MKFFALLLLLCPAAFGVEEIIDSDLSSQSGIPSFQVTEKRVYPKCAEEKNKEFERPTPDQNLGMDDQSQLMALMSQRNMQFQVQYQRVLRSNPCAFGAVRIHVELAPSGVPAKFSYVAERKSMEEVARQIAPIIMGMNFGGALSASSFEYTLNFLGE